MKAIGKHGAPGLDLSKKRAVVMHRTPQRTRTRVKMASNVFQKGIVTDAK